MVLVTVGVPVFNGANYLGSTLDSLSKQTHEELEILVADNASTDATVDIVRAAMQCDPRIRLLCRPENIGAAANYNHLVTLARGSYFKWSAHDDLCAPPFVERCVEALEADPGAVLAYPRSVLIGPDDEILDEHFVDDLYRAEADPVERLRRYLPHRGEQHAIFGLIRTDRLRRTRMIGTHWGGDMVALTDLLLQGRFIELEDRLFMRRYHEATSMAGITAAEINQWFDPHADPTTAMPRTRLFGAHLHGVTRSALPPPVKLRALAAVITVWLRHWGRHMGGEVKIAARARVTRARSHRP